MNAPIRKYFLCMLLLTGCTEVFDLDISGQWIKLLSPPNDYETTLSTITFWWEEMEFADYYRLQIVSPSFEYIERLFADTTISATQFTTTLLPGAYQWRVCGVNNSGNSNYSVHNLTIDSTNDISQDIIQLIYPYHHDTCNKIEYKFQWQPLYNADDYNFEVYFEGSKIYSINWPYDTINHILTEGDGSYEWKVRGQNEFSNTIYSSRNIYVDTQSPGKPELVQPINESVLQDTLIQFQWIRYSSGGSSSWDSLFVYNDSLMTDVLIEKFLRNPGYVDSIGPGEYYWRVKTYDAAGNQSSYSYIWSFKISAK